MLANLDLGALKGAAAAGAAKKNNKFNKGNKNKAKAKFNAARSGSADRSKSTEGQAPRATQFLSYKFRHQAAERQEDQRIQGGAWLRSQNRSAKSL